MKPYISLMRCSSHGVLPDTPSACLSTPSASCHFFSFIRSLALGRNLLSPLLIVCFASFFAASWSCAASARCACAVLTGTSPAVAVSSAPTASVTTQLCFVFIFLALLLEFRIVHEADLLHAVALRGGQHLRHKVVLHAAIGPQVNLRLRVFGGFRVKVALQLVHALHGR